MVEDPEIGASRLVFWDFLKESLVILIPVFISFLAKPFENDWFLDFDRIMGFIYVPLNPGHGLIIIEPSAMSHIRPDMKSCKIVVLILMVPDKNGSYNTVLCCCRYIIDYVWHPDPMSCSGGTYLLWGSTPHTVSSRRSHPNCWQSGWSVLAHTDRFYKGRSPIFKILIHHRHPLLFEIHPGHH